MPVDEDYQQPEAHRHSHGGSVELTERNQDWKIGPQAARDTESPACAEYLTKHLKSRLDEYTICFKIRVLAGTWNVNGRKCTDDLSPWLDTSSSPDLVVLGFQEIVPLTAGAVFWETSNPTVTKHWESKVEAALAKNGVFYSKVVSQQMVGVHLIVYAKDSVRGNIKDVQVDTVGVGILGVMGNKGAVACRMRIYDDDVCFASCHLSAHELNVDRRNADFKQILQRVDLGLKSQDQNEPHPILACQHVVVVGDFNYRLRLPVPDIMKLINSKDFVKLVTYDQLTIEKEAGRVFTDGWYEAPITFAPTYKYGVGTKEYAIEGEKKIRPPAYTDRILKWCERGQSCCQLLSYGRHDLLGSDHRPVSASLVLQVRSVVKDRYDAVYQEELRKLDEIENDSLPQVSLSDPLLEFGDVYFGVPVSKALTVTNIGQVGAHFQFVPKEADESVHKPWLMLSAKGHILAPGESSEIIFTVDVERDCASSLNAKEELLDDILVLHLVNGRDFFVVVHGNYKPSCFGCSLEYLAGLRRPVRQPDQSDSGSAKEDVSKGGNRKFGRRPRTPRVPDELVRLADLVSSKGLDTHSIFFDSGVPKELFAIQEALDTGDEFPSVSPLSAGEAFVHFLDCLKVPVIPSQYQQRCLEGTEDPSLFLSPVHVLVFSFIVALLEKILEHSEANGSTPLSLASLFSAVLFRSGHGPRAPNQPSQSQSDDRRRIHFLLKFLPSPSPKTSSSSPSPKTSSSTPPAQDDSAPPPLPPRTSSGIQKPL